MLCQVPILFLECKQEFVFLPSPYSQSSPSSWCLSTLALGLFSILCLKGNINATFIFCHIRDPCNGFTTKCVESANDLNINENVFQKMCLLPAPLSTV